MDPALALVLRFALACLLVWAVAHKLRGFAAFVVTFNEYRLMPVSFSAPGAVLLVGIEAAIALGYMIPAWAQAAGVAGAGLFLLYAGAIGINLLRGRTHIDCGCFGPGRGEPISSAMVARNVVLALVSAACIWPVADRALVWLDAFTVAGGIVFASALYVSANRLITLLPMRLRHQEPAQGEQL